MRSFVTVVGVVAAVATILSFFLTFFLTDEEKCQLFGIACLGEPQMSQRAPVDTDSAAQTPKQATEGKPTSATERAKGSDNQAPSGAPEAPPQASAPPQEAPAGSAPPVSIPSQANSRIFDAISLEDLASPEKSEVPFPSAYFRSRLGQELGSRSTTIPRIRVAVAFIEPFETRRHAAGGTIIGYILVSLPSLTECERKFGPQTYNFPDAATGIMKAVNDYASEIADWIQNASIGEELTCPVD
jgi:hypothetical protein